MNDYDWVLEGIKITSVFTIEVYIKIKWALLILQQRQEGL